MTQDIEQAYIQGDFVKGAIARKLSAAQLLYPTTIYKDRQLQQFTKPAVLIRQLNVQPKRLLRGRQKFVFSMNVMYYPKSQDRILTELDLVSKLLIEELSCIYTPILISGKVSELGLLGTQISTAVTEDILNVFVTYTVYSEHMANLPKMQELELYSNIKEEE